MGLDVTLRRYGDRGYAVVADGIEVGQVYKERQGATHARRAHVSNDAGYGRGRTCWVNNRNNADDFATRAEALDDLLRKVDR